MIKKQLFLFFLVTIFMLVLMTACTDHFANEKEEQQIGLSETINLEKTQEPQKIEEKTQANKTENLPKDNENDQEKVEKEKSEEEDNGITLEGNSRNNIEQEKIEENQQANIDSTEREEDKSENDQIEILEEKNTVTFTIVGPLDVGLILKTVEVEIQEKDTVLDILKRVTRQNRIQMEYRGRGSTAYVEGINNLYQFDRGPGSGWMYSIDGEIHSKSAGAWQVSAGEDIRWLYTQDLGRDLDMDEETNSKEEDRS